MESAKRPVPDYVARKVVRLFGLSPTELPFSGSESPPTNDTLAQELARLGYPGFAYLRKPGRMQNPISLLVGALTMADPDSRLVEALPWLLLRFEGFNVDVMVDMVRARNLQNRLGFAVALASEVAARNPLYAHRGAELRHLQTVLESSRLANEDTFGRYETSNQMRAWVKENRSEAASYWNVLTDLKTEHLPYAN